jgi:hypothetical protein
MLVTGCGHQENAMQIYRGSDQIGNGGKGVICRDGNDKVLSAEILDFYEGRVLYGRIPQPVADDVSSVLQRWLEPLWTYDAPRYQRYSKQLADFAANSRFVEAQLLLTIDSEEIIKPPKGCEVEQIIVQSEPLLPGQKRFVINRPLWEALDHLNQAGLMLHEVIYQEALAQGHHNSISSRYMTALIAADELADLSQDVYSDLLFQARLGFAQTPQPDFIWTWIQSSRLNWTKAQRACHFFDAGRLGSIDEFHRIAQHPPSREQLLRLSTLDQSEFWTNEFTVTDGLVEIVTPHAAQNFLTGSRQPDFYANTLCFKGDSHDSEP